MRLRYAILLILLSAVTATAQTKTKGKTVWNGIYSADQAARGEEEYKTNCSRCHGATLAGTQGNGLKGKDFMERWREDSMGSLYEFVTNGMPPVRKGVGRPLISIPTYLDILAYILSQNDFPAGPNPLTSEGLDEIQVEYKDGPRPVPSGALVRIAGCLSGSGQVWNITNANDPIRTRTSETLDYQEFQTAASEPPGTQSYRLANLGFLSSTFKPESHAGERLMVKGNLVRQTDNTMRISVLAVRKIADTCP